MNCYSIEVRQVVVLTWQLHLRFKGKPFLMKHGIGEQQPFKNLEIPGGGGHQNTPWNGNFEGVPRGS